MWGMEEEAHLFHRKSSTPENCPLVFDEGEERSSCHYSLEKLLCRIPYFEKLQMKVVLVGLGWVFVTISGILPMIRGYLLLVQRKVGLSPGK